MNKRWVDPPSGWKYGFPKIWDGTGDLREWLVAEGYPQNKWIHTVIIFLFVGGVLKKKMCRHILIDENIAIQKRFNQNKTACRCKNFTMWQSLV